MEHLPSTAPVVGLFPEWECPAADRELAPGDLLAIYTDGITESFNLREEEFGEPRLIDTLRRHRGRSPAEMVEAVLSEVGQFSPGEQGDDRTLIVARCTGTKA